MAFIKHIGKHGDRSVAVMYRTVPGEEHMALVIYPDTLSTMFHDSVMRVIESKEGQDASQLADAMHSSLLSDGRPILQTLHQEGKLKKVRTNQIVITPNAKSHIRLDELNKIFDGDEAGKQAKKDRDSLEIVDPVEQAENAKELESAGYDLVSDASLGDDLLTQSKQMSAEGTALIAEGKRLEKEAFKLNPALKPKRVVKKKATKKK